MKQNKDNRKKGSKGEKLARIFLQQKGYSIKHTNWHFGHKELDIISVKDNMLVITEVKSRTSTLFEDPVDAVSDRKIRMIVDATEAYMEVYDIEMEVQFDVITVLFHKDGQTEIEHYEDAFIPPVS